MIDKMQEAFDYAMENGVVIEVHELMEAFSEGFEDPADVLDFVVGVPADILRAEIEERNAQ